MLLDVKMPGMDGIEVLDRLRAMNESLPVIVISGHGTIEHRRRSDEEGRRSTSSRSRSPASACSSACATRSTQRQLRDENRSLKKAVEVRHQMIGDSPGLKQVMAAVGRAAPTNATVLIQGESGVGKELVARTIHRNSLRSRERFVQVNCAAIPEELIESELFGHEKGSFTGATEKQVGKFEQADRGTIFLDEVGDMSAKTQAKVLRVLQEGEVERLGSARTIKVDVRVIAATNKNLEEEIEKGHFREDLYFRLAVIPIQVPPLRERPEDIPLLVRHYMDYFAARTTSEPKRIHQARWRPCSGTAGRGTSASSEHSRAADHHDGRRNDRRLGPARNRSKRCGRLSNAGTAGEGESSRAGTLREFKDSTERAYLVAKLRENGWNISKTAEVIDTPRSNLYKKLEQYQISQETDG